MLRFKDTGNVQTARIKMNLVWLAMLAPVIVSINGLVERETEKPGGNLQSKFQLASETSTITRLNQTQQSRKQRTASLADLTTFVPDEENVDRTTTKFDTPTQNPSLQTSTPPPTMTSPPVLSPPPTTTHLPASSPPPTTTHLPASSSPPTMTPPPASSPPLTMTPPPVWTTFCPLSIGFLVGGSDCRQKEVEESDNIPERPVRTEYVTPYPPPSTTPYPPPLTTPYPLPTTTPHAQTYPSPPLYTSPPPYPSPAPSTPSSTSPYPPPPLYPSPPPSTPPSTTPYAPSPPPPPSATPYPPLFTAPYTPPQSSTPPTTPLSTTPYLPPPSTSPSTLPLAPYPSPPSATQYLTTPPPTTRYQPQRSTPASTSPYPPQLSTTLGIPHSLSIPVSITPLPSLPSSQNSPRIISTSSTRTPSSKRTLSSKITTTLSLNKQTTSPRVTTISATKTREPGIKYKVFDDYKNLSREVRCFKHFVYRNGECHVVNTDTYMKITATLVIKLQREHGTSNHYFYSGLAWLNLLIIKHFSLPKLAEVEYISIDQHENSSLLYRANVVTFLSSKVDLKEYISTLISVFHGRNLSDENTVEKTKTMHPFHYNFHFQSASDYLNHQRFTRVKETIYIIRRRLEYLKYTFAKTIFCPMVVLDKSEVFFNDKYQMCLTHFNVCFDSLVYHQGNSIQVCMEDYFAILDRNFQKTARKHIWVYQYTPEGVLSLVLMCLSALCLIITLVIHFLCPELRTLPGKSSMFLSASLLLAQLTFQFGMTQNDFPLPCKIIGLFIHYFWLLSFSWMSACSIQMFLKFGRFATGTTMNSTKRLLKYCFYAFGSPFLFISTNIVYSLVSSSGKEYGYGLDLCYISYPLMVFITFTAPAYLVTIKNVALFVIVCCRIGRHRKIQSASSQFSRSKVLVKLSCLTGCLWLVGFVNHWVKLDVLQYIFIVLNASQGIFIMVSFVCTKRVFGMLQKRWK